MKKLSILLLILSLLFSCSKDNPQAKLKKLEERLKQVPSDATCLVIADAVFSMDGDVIDLPSMAALCR